MYYPPCDIIHCKDAVEKKLDLPSCILYDDLKHNIYMVFKSKNLLMPFFLIGGTVKHLG